MRNIAELAPHEKVWGAEYWIENNDRYCCKVLVLNAGRQCSLHHHKLKDETFLMLSGRVILEVDDAVETMRAGDFIRLRPNTEHRFRGIERSVMIEISTHHDDADSYRAEASR